MIHTGYVDVMDHKRSASLNEKAENMLFMSSLQYGSGCVSERTFPTEASYTNRLLKPSSALALGISIYQIIQIEANNSCFP
jgi:hypothetical protein